MNLEDLEEAIGSYVSGWKIISVVLGSRRGKQVPVGLLAECQKCNQKKRITKLMLSKAAVPKCSVCYPPKRKTYPKTNYQEKYPREYQTWVQYVKRDSCKGWKKFTRFLSDIGEKPPGARLFRKDKNKQHSPANSYYK